VTWRIESRIGARDLFQYVVADGEEAMLIDTGTARTPHEVVLPALRHLGVPPDRLRLIVVTHPDLDHQGGLAGLKEAAPAAQAACGFADRGLVADPERLLRDRYGAYEDHHAVGYSDAEKVWIRSLYGAPAAVDVTWSGGEVVAVGDRKLEVMRAPGHSAGHLMIWDPTTRQLFSSDAIHGRMCPAADGAPALPPTYEEVDAYVESIGTVESLGVAELHSGHWPQRTGEDVLAFLGESRDFVAALDTAVLERLERPAGLRELCEHAEQRLGPFGADPVNLMFAVHGHLRRLVSRGAVRVDSLRRPPIFSAHESLS
jgi:glyoxylase-like metal-dependent hydrolase (beta-lactamase superfamily II)